MTQHYILCKEHFSCVPVNIFPLKRVAINKVPLRNCDCTVSIYRKCNLSYMYICVIIPQSVIFIVIG